MQKSNIRIYVSRSHITITKTLSHNFKANILVIFTVQLNSVKFSYVLFVLYKLKNRLGNPCSYLHEKLSPELDLYNEHIFKPVLLIVLKTLSHNFKANILVIFTVQLNSVKFSYVLFVLYKLKNRLGNPCSYLHEKLSPELDLYNEHIFKPVLLIVLDL